MALKLNSSVFHAALGKAHAGEIDHGEWEAPAGADRNVDNSIAMDDSDSAIPSEKFKYPILKGGKVSAKGVGSALGYATKNAEHAIIPALTKISEAIKGQSDSNLSMNYYEALGKLAERIDLSRLAPLAKCPGCGSHDVQRTPADSEHSGPMDKCTHCGQQWSMKPGTTTVFKYSSQFDSSEPDEENESDSVAPAPVIAQEPNGGNAYDQDAALTTPFLDTPANPDGSPNTTLHSDYAQRLFGVRIG